MITHFTDENQSLPQVTEPVGGNSAFLGSGLACPPRLLPMATASENWFLGPGPCRRVNVFKNEEFGI